MSDAATAPRRILLVDDGDDMTRLLPRFLVDYDVTVARDGAEGIERALTLRPELVIADVAMPGVDGVRFAEALREDPILSKVPVILLAVARDARRVGQSLSVGAKHLVHKPFDVHSLLALVARTLGETARTEPPARGDLETARMTAIRRTG